MPAHITRYRPSVHGFRFANRFRPENVGPVSLRGWSSGICHVSLDFFHAGRVAPAIEYVEYGVRPVSGVGAASWAPDRVDLFVRRDDNLLATKLFMDGRFSDWRALVSSEGSRSPAATSGRPDRIDVVMGGDGGRLWHHWYDNGWVATPGTCRALPGFHSELGGDLDSSPAIAAPSAGRVMVFARGADGCLWSKCFDGAWHDWRSLGKPEGVTLISDPAAAAHAEWMTVLVVGSDGAIWQREWTENRWQDWRSLGGDPATAPAVASPFPGRAESYVCGTDGRVHLNTLTGGRWRGWKPIGAPPPGLSSERPAAISHADVMDVFVLAKDHTVWHKRWWNGWQPWQSTEITFGLTTRTLTEAIHHRLVAHTVTPMLAAIASGPQALGGNGTAGKFIEQSSYTDDKLFRWASTREMSKLDHILKTGNPVSVGLLHTDGLGHEVVVYGGEVKPGGRSTLRLYDPDYSGCDEMTIDIDPVSRTITSASGETWRSLWVRDDIEPQTPPI